MTSLGLGPRTPALKVWCSDLLSYEVNSVEWERQDSNLLSLWATDLQSATTLQLRRFPDMFSFGAAKEIWPTAVFLRSEKKLHFLSKKYVHASKTEEKDGADVT